MPPLPDPPNPTLRFTLNWKVGADPLATSRMFFTYTGGTPTAADCASFATDAVNFASSEFAGLMHPQITLESATVVDITTTSGNEGTAGTPFVGTRSGGQLSPGTCVLVRHTIGTRYRGGKPRSYLPFGTSTDIGTTGLWNTGLVTAVDTAWGGYISVLVGDTAGTITIASYIALSYYSGVNPPVTLPSGRVKQSSKVRTAPLQYLITGHTTSNIIASQRRRNRDA